MDLLDYQGMSMLVGVPIWYAQHQKQHLINEKRYNRCTTRRITIRISIKWSTNLEWINIKILIAIWLELTQLRRVDIDGVIWITWLANLERWCSHATRRYNAKKDACINNSKETISSACGRWSTDKGKNEVNSDSCGVRVRP